jgi:hypothetical protein
MQIGEGKQDIADATTVCEERKKGYSRCNYVRKDSNITDATTCM